MQTIEKQLIDYVFFTLGYSLGFLDNNISKVLLTYNPTLVSTQPTEVIRLKGASTQDKDIVVSLCLQVTEKNLVTYTLLVYQLVPKKARTILLEITGVEEDLTHFYGVIEHKVLFEIEEELRAYSSLRHLQRLNKVSQIGCKYKDYTTFLVETLQNKKISLEMPVALGTGCKLVNYDRLIAT